MEGTIEFTALLYVPSMAPFEQQDWLKPSRNVRLFVKRVFISDEFDGDLLPRWASFVRGIVDSADLPLNVSREILQESRVVRVIRRQLVKRTIEMLKVRKKEEEEEEKEEEEGGAGATSRNSLDLEQKPHFFLLFQKSNNNPTRRRSPPAPPAPTRTTQTTC